MVQVLHAQLIYTSHTYRRPFPIPRQGGIFRECLFHGMLYHLLGSQLDAYSGGCLRYTWDNYLYSQILYLCFHLYVQCHGSETKLEPGGGASLRQKSLKSRKVQPWSSRKMC